jgi:hypothetical protein
MREASEVVLAGFPLRTDAQVVRHPDRYTDERGRRMWEAVDELLAEREDMRLQPLVDEAGATC